MTPTRIRYAAFTGVRPVAGTGRGAAACRPEI
jgi:hypothetical protein